MAEIKHYNNKYKLKDEAQRYDSYVLMSVGAIAISVSTRVNSQHDTTVAWPTINIPQDTENQCL
eukprot:18581-Heterococcus_DN1.PRE.1